MSFMEKQTENDSLDQLGPSPDTVHRRVPNSWAALMGRWEKDDAEVRYVPGDPAWQAGGERIAIGISVCEVERFSRGTVSAEVSFSPPFPTGPHGAGIILGFQSMDREFY